MARSFLGRLRSLSHGNPTRKRGSLSNRRLFLEQLERREMLTSIPVALNDPLYSTAVNTTLTISAVASGLRNNDFDAEGTTLSLSVVNGPASGSLTTFNTDGTFTYVPNSSFTGIDTFTYKASDGTNDSNVATVSIAVGGNFGPRTNLDEVPLDAMLLTGGLTLAQPLTMGHELIYRSDTVNPHPLVVLETSLLSSSSVPDQIDAELTFNGNSQGTVEYDTTGLSAGDPLRFVLQADASSLATGYYNYSVELTAWFGSTPVSRTYSGSQAVVNRTTSEFGAGWWLAGLDELVISGSNALLVKANGDAIWFAGNGSGGYLKAAGDLDHSTLVKNVDNSFTLTSKYGDKTNFGTTGLLTSRVDTNGNSVTYTHTSGLLTEIVDPFSRDTDLTYTSGLLTTFEDLANRASTLAYSSGKLTSVTLPDPDGGAGPLAAPVYEFGYDATTALLDTASNPLDQDTIFGYDAASFRLDTITHPDSNVWDLNPIQVIGLASGAGNTLTSPADAIGQITDERGKLWKFKTDRFGNLTTWTDPLDNSTQWERDANGRAFRLTEADPDGSGTTYTSPVTKFGFSAAGDLVLEVLPDNNDRSYTWNTLSRQLTFTDERNETWTNTYDTNGNMATSVDPLGNQTSLLYTLAGLVRSITTPDPDGAGSQTAATKEIDYDTYGRIELITYPDASTQAFAYNSADRLTTFTDELNHNWTQTWDNLDRLTSATTAESETNSFTYNVASLLTSETDPLGNTTNYTHNTRSWVTKIEMPDPDGAGSLPRVTRDISYNAVGQVVGEAPPDGSLGPETGFVFDDAGRVIQNTVDGQVYGYTRDNLGRVIQTTAYIAFAQDLDPVNYEKYEYNSRNWIVTIVQANPTSAQLEDGPETTFTYNASGQILTETNARGYTTTNAYDERGLLTQTTLADPDGAGGLASPIYAFGHDNVGRLISVSDPLSNVTAYAWDSRDRLTSVTGADPDGGGSQTAPVTQYGYDDASRLTTVTDPLNRVTTMGFDNAHRRTSLTLPDPDGLGSLTSPVYAWAYNDAGSVTSSTDPLGNVTSFTYDAMQRLIGRTDPDPDGAGSLTSPVTSFTFNTSGFVSKITDALTHETTFGHDAFGRVTSVTNHQGKTTTTAYAQNGQIISVTTPDPDGAGSQSASETEYGYDRWARLTTITDPLAGVTSFTHDAIGNVLTLTDAEDNTTTWAYDGLNRVTSETNELNDARTFEYNAASLLTKLTDRNGRVLEYSYDNLHRLTTETWKTGGNTVRTLGFTYDAASQLTAAEDADSEYGYGYDNLGRVLTVSNAGTSGAPTVVLTAAYDANSRRTSLAAEIGSTDDFLNTFTYDNLGRMTRVEQIGQTGGNTVANKRIDFAYNAVNQFTTITRYAKPSSTWNEVATSTFTYETLNRLTALDHKHGSTNIANYDWTYDHMNRATQFVGPDGTSDYSYDGASQLTTADHSYQSDETNSYDGTGNRTNTGYTTGANNQLTSDGVYNYTYDDEGNRLTRTRISDGHRTEYTWDHRNRLTAVVERAGGVGTAITKQVDYAYDVFDRRIKKSVDADGAGSGTAVVARYVYDGDHIALQFDGSNNLTHRYLHGPAVDMILADEDGTNDVLWPLADNLGTVRDLVDDSGTVQNHMEYGAFGQVTAESNAAVDHLFAYTGRERDEETGLQYHRKRYYDPAAGRWISEDPSGFASGDPNLSRYVVNDAPNLIDASGLEGEDNNLHLTLATDSVSISIFAQVGVGAGPANALPGPVRGTWLGENVIHPVVTTFVDNETFADSSDTTLVVGTTVASIPIAIGILFGGEFILGVGTFGTAGTAAASTTAAGTTAGGGIFTGLTVQQISRYLAVAIPAYLNNPNRPQEVYFRLLNLINQLPDGQRQQWMDMINRH